MTTAPVEYRVRLRTPHAEQQRFIESTAKRKVIRAGRRGGKTVGAAILAVEYFLRERRVLYATPTADQITRFWFEVKRALQEPLDHGVLYKNETEHVIELPGTSTRIRAKTAWNADTLRGDYADLLILDEWQMMNEEAWALVGAPMLLDNDGDAVFIYTPPSAASATATRARDPRHAAKMYKAAAEDTTGRWAAFHFSSRMNPYISEVALNEITRDMTALAVRQEIEAEDIDDVPGALWTRSMIDAKRVTAPTGVYLVAVGVDPSVTDASTSDEAGIVVAAAGECNCKGDTERHVFVLDDLTLRGSPLQWATAAVSAYHLHHANMLVAESNQGGQMVELTINTIPYAPQVTLVHAKDSKRARAEPVAALYERGCVHHVGYLAALEDEMCGWVATSPRSPNRIDALVHAISALGLTNSAGIVGWD